jgi:hypothetical protein
MAPEGGAQPLLERGPGLGRREAAHQIADFGGGEASRDGHELHRVQPHLRAGLGPRLGGEKRGDPVLVLGPQPVPFMALALVLALVMREQPLSEEMIEVARGEAEVPEY